MRPYGQEMKRIENEWTMFDATAAIAIVVAGGVLSGWVASWLWLWFVVPVFEVAPLSVGQAYGLMLVLRFALAAHQTAKSDRTKTETFGYLIGWSIGWPLLAVGIGYIVTAFI